MPAGIANVGNTCCINTCVQCIWALPNLRELIAKTKYDQPDGLGVCLQEVLAIMSSVAEEKNPDKVLVPRQLVERVTGLSDGRFHPGEQYDLHEIWMWMLDRLHQEAAVQRQKPLRGGSQMENMVLSSLHTHQDGKYSGIQGRTHGSMVALVKCNKCSYKVTNVEPFGTIVCEPGHNILDTFRQDVLTDWSCDKCKEKGGTRTIRWFHAPHILVLVLKRFSADGRCKKSNPVEIQCAVGIPDEYVMKDGCRYELRAIGNHFGGFSSGHYTAHLRCPKESTWYHVDDDHFTVHDEGVLCSITQQNPAAYMLFYQAVPP